MASLSGPADSLNHPDAGDGMMSSVESTPEREARLESTFGAHFEVVCQRSARALTVSGYAGLLVHSGSLLDVFEDDRTYPFEANAPFKVWVPLQDAAECFVWFEPGAVPRLIIHRAQDYWHKSADLPRAYWTRHFQVRTATDRAGARAQLPADLSRAAYIGDALPELSRWGIGAINPRQLMRRLDYARAVKTPYELACLREASRLGARGHRAAERAFAAGASELGIELAFLEGCGQREQELPYNPIIALNAGRAVLHYQVLERQPPRERHSLLIAAGAPVQGYASDITRTYSAGDADFALLVGRMDQMQQTLCAGVRAGVDWRDVQLRAPRLLAELLREADITRCSAEEAIASAVTSVFLPHGIGHLLGLEVHDVAGFMRSTQAGDIPRPAR